MKPGQDEPQYDARHDKVNKTSKNLEMLDPDPEDFDLVLPDSDDDEDDDLGNKTRKKRKTKRKKTRKVLSLDSFMNLSNDAVLAATTFHHYHGEGDNDFIEWTILREGEEIVEDVMQHDNTSPFSIDIPWEPGVGAVDYFDIFFNYFFPSLEGKAAVLDKYLSNPLCSGHNSYYVHEKVRFHQPDRPDPDYIVSSFFVWCCAHSSALSLPHIVNL
jgi:hypothetical protein